MDVEWRNGYEESGDNSIKMNAITPYKWGWGEFGEAVAFWGFVGRGGSLLAPKVVRDVFIPKAVR